MSLAISLATYRAGPATEETWDDLRVCLGSVKAYARGIETVVAWDGPSPPNDLPPNPMCRVLARPPGMQSGTAWRWAIEQTDADDLVMLSDDVVLQPDTIDKLVQDVATLRGAGHRVGFLGCRSNFSIGRQNIRCPNGGTWSGSMGGFTSEDSVLKVDRISPACALISRTASDICGAPDVEWFSDDIPCYDLSQVGYTHWVSRAYVHHIGMRSSEPDRAVAIARLEAEATTWVQEHRPDFWQHLQGRIAAAAAGREPDADQRPQDPDSTEGQPELSVVLAVTDGMRMTIRALQSVRAACADAGGIELIVIDNGSTDGTQAALAQLSAATEAVRVVRLPQPIPAQSAWLQGASKATGRLILFLSNDVQLTEGFLDPLKQALGAGASGAAPVLRSVDADRAMRPASGPTWLS